MATGNEINIIFSLLFQRVVPTAFGQQEKEKVIRGPRTGFFGKVMVRAGYLPAMSTP
jgi:hypothetical protein